MITTAWYLILFHFTHLFVYIIVSLPLKMGGKKINNQETVETAKSESFEPSLEMSKHENFRERWIMCK